GHPASLRRARIYFGRGDVKKGLADLDAFLMRGGQLDPNSPQVAAERGRWMRVMVGELPGPVRKAHLELSLGLLQKAAAGGGGPAALYDELGAALESLGKVPAAIAAYTEAIKRSTEARLLVKRAWAYEKVEDFDKAGVDFTAAIQLSPDYAEAHAGLGYVQACRGKIGGAASRPAAEAVLRGGSDYLLLHNVACVYGKLSEKVEALDPGRAREYQDLALAY